MFKTSTGSKKSKKTKPGSSKTCTGTKNAKPRCNVRGQGLIGLDFCIFAFFEQVLELPGLDFLHLFELVQVLEPWTLKTCTGSKNPKQQILYLFLKNGRQIAELFHRSIVLQNFPEVSISVSGLLLQSLQHLACGLPQVDTLVPVSPLGRSNSPAQDGAPGGAVDILQAVAQNAPKPIHDLRARFHADLVTVRGLHVIDLRIVGFGPVDLALHDDFFLLVHDIAMGHTASPGTPWHHPCGAPHACSTGTSA